MRAKKTKVWIVWVTGSKFSKLVVIVYLFLSYKGVGFFVFCFLQASRSATDNPEAVKSAQWDSKVSAYAKSSFTSVLAREYVSQRTSELFTNEKPPSSTCLSCSTPYNPHDQMSHPPCDVTKGSWTLAITSSGSVTTHSQFQLAVCSAL